MNSEELHIDPRFTEVSEGDTPSGGAYSVAYFYNENWEPCTKQEARRINIIEYDKDNKRVNEFYMERQ